jgi:hypothetical protein
LRQLVREAAVAGLDPAEGWDPTPAELQEYIDAYKGRMELQAYMCYNLAQTIACMVLSSEKPRPWDAFPGWIKPKTQTMTDDEIYSSCLAWCATPGKEDE